MNQISTKILRPLKRIWPTVKITLILFTFILILGYGLFVYFPLLTLESASGAAAAASESMSEPVSDSTLNNASVHVLDNLKLRDNNPKASDWKKSSGSIITESLSPTRKVTITGTVTSKDDPIQATGLEQSYYIFSLGNSSNTYSGVITFTSSKPVQLQSINILTLNNTLKLPVQFGTLYTFPLNNTIIITSNLFDEPKVAGTVSFSGNSLRFIANEPFLLTYSFSGEQSQSLVKNDIESGLEIYRKLIGTRS
ncbi:MAG TPA: hypothetical protein VLE21_02170 [Candidatus Nitrosocosmicus sp.]|nr:hypothetical protein [Candidatus Nitrosocosmicus sp.]